MFELLLFPSLFVLLLLSIVIGLFLGLRKSKEHESGIDSVSFNPKQRQECVIPKPIIDRESELPPTVSEKRNRNSSEEKDKIDWLTK